MNLKTKMAISTALIGVATIAYAGAYYEVTVGVTPGCASGATVTRTVWSEGAFGACDVAVEKSSSTSFKYCCAVKEKK